MVAGRLDGARPLEEGLDAEPLLRERPPRWGDAGAGVGGQLHAVQLRQQPDRLGHAVLSSAWSASAAASRTYSSPMNPQQESISSPSASSMT